MIVLILIALLFCGSVYGEEINLLGLKGKYYENDGCIYFIGDFTEEELLIEQQKFEKRMEKLSKQFEIERQRKHELKIETIKAQAMKDYLIAQNTPLREIADAIKRIKIEQTITIGDITAQSYSSVGNVTSEGSNATATGTGGSGTSTTTNTNTNRQGRWPIYYIKPIPKPITPIEPVTLIK